MTQSQAVAVPAEAGDSQPSVSLRAVAAGALVAAAWGGVGLALVLIPFSYVAAPALWKLNADGTVAGLGATVAMLTRVFLMHIGVAAALAAGVAAAMRRRRLLAAALVLAVPILASEAWAFRPRAVPPVAGEPLRVLSINTFANNGDPEVMLAEALRLRPDVICFQEWHPAQEQAIAARLLDRWPHAWRQPEYGTSGVAVFSNRPLLEMGDLRDEMHRAGPSRMQRVVVEHEGRPLAIYNLHPTSPQAPRLVLANRQQIAKLVWWLPREPLPYLLVGDLNAHTRSQQLDALRRLGLVEAQEAAGVGPGHTWPNHEGWRFLPGIRIDHVFASPELAPLHAEVGRRTGSDHRPVVADVAWR